MTGRGFVGGHFNWTTLNYCQYRSDDALRLRAAARRDVPAAPTSVNALLGVLKEHRKRGFSII